ncbi:hypothetical protein ACFQAT_01420 [Undibacterium arcticum]|jgi:hypothetical protein|uniref:Uncharacterized protein n=1 Tax=Undibacterium arcticum TaxID=1762892 RepID=A0ABV7F1K3_9BURK
MQTQVKHWLIGAAVTALLGLIFVSYLRTSFIVDLANRFFMCF